jgi:ATP-dependent HslUV protease ATP-binding subunit HslU
VTLLTEARLKDLMTPRQIVEELDRYIIGQKQAKRAVAVALRNRFRRERLSEELRDEVIPKNILMIGPTGVGKTEVARRLARLAQAPFLKVEATKFTEVGYIGRDVETIIRDLVEIAVRMVETERIKDVEDKAAEAAVERLVIHLAPPARGQESSANNPFQSLFAQTMSAMGGVQPQQEKPPETPGKSAQQVEQERAELRRKLLAGELDDRYVELELEESGHPGLSMLSGTPGMGEMGVDMGEILGGILPKRKKARKLKISEARGLIAQEEARKLIDNEDVRSTAKERVERRGIVFLDEMDKIAGRTGGHGPDVSREGVQRDLLPIIEGSTVNTKYGAVKTDHILFIAAGAFHVSKPSDLIPELQGRFPIRVELESLTQADFERILTEPENALTRQYQALLATEEVRLTFTESGIKEMAAIAQQVNESTENIGARRLHTIMEKVLEEISFDAPELERPEVTVDQEFVRSRLQDVLEDKDLSRYIL